MKSFVCVRAPYLQGFHGIGGMRTCLPIRIIEPRYTVEQTSGELRNDDLFQSRPFFATFPLGQKIYPNPCRNAESRVAFCAFFLEWGWGASDLLSWQTLKRSGKLRRDGGGEGMSSKRQHKRFPMMQMEKREEESNFPSRRFPRTHAPLGK